MKIGLPEMPPATLLTALGTYNLLPAIVFLPTRRRCDQAASEAAYLRRDPSDQGVNNDATCCAALSNSIPKFAATAIGKQSCVAVWPRIMPATCPLGN